MNRKPLRPNIVIALIVALIAAGALASQSFADQLDPWTHGFYVLACDHDPGVPPLRDAVFPPDGCRGVDRVSLSLESPEGYAAGQCLTGANGWCSLSGDFGRTYIVRAEGADPVPGYTALANPTIYTRETAIGAGFVFVPNDVFASAPSSASLTAHFRVCPTDYAGANLFADCHDTLPSYAQTLEVYGPNHRSANTGPDGNAMIDKLDPGDYSVRLAFPENTGGASVYCSDASRPGIELPSSTYLSFDRQSRRAITNLSIQADISVVCDVYVVPTAVDSEAATITFHFRTCDEIVAPELIYNACHDNGSAGLFDVYGSANDFYLMGYRDDVGNATVRVPPGRYTAAHGPGHNIGSEYVYCSQNGVDDSGIESFPYVNAGETWTCDVYIHFVTFK